MRSKHPKDGSSGFYTGGDLSLSREELLAKNPADLRKNEGKLIVAASSRGKSKCASVREGSRSGGSTPRCDSDSPTPKIEIISAAAKTRDKEPETETPKTYLIKDSFLEPDVSRSVLGAITSTGKNGAGRRSPKNMITCASPIASGNKFLSEIEEVEWYLDGDRLGGGDGGGGSGRRDIEIEEEDQRERDRVWRKIQQEDERERDQLCRKIEEREMLRRKGKAPQGVGVLEREEEVADGGGERRGKAPMAFPTVEDDLPRMFSDGTTRCLFEAHETASLLREDSHIGGAVRESDKSAVNSRIHPEMPAWFESAYESLARLDDQEDEQIQPYYSQISERVLLDAGASSSSSNYWQQRPQVDQPLSETNEPSSLDERQVLSEEEKNCLEERVRSEIRKVVEQQEQDEEGSTEIEDDAANKIRQQGPGWLWKMSLYASVSFVTWVLVSGARIQCRSLFPTIREREQPVKIVKRRKDRLYEAEDT